MHNKSLGEKDKFVFLESFPCALVTGPATSFAEQIRNNLI